MKAPEEFDEERRRILHRMSMITWALGGAAVFFAVVGGALLAWIFMGAGLPFLRTWLIISLLLLLVPVLVHVSPWPRRGGEDEGDGPG